MPIGVPTETSQTQPNESLQTEPKPTLLGAFQSKPLAPSFGRQSPLESTPGISGEINDKLIIGSTSEETTDDDDSLLDTDSVMSDDDETPFYGLPNKHLPTGLCYDDRMRYHAEVASTSENSLHPEDPRRIFYIFKELSEAGLVAGGKNQRPLVSQPLLRIDAREATEEECCMVSLLIVSAFYKSCSSQRLVVRWE